MKAPWLSRHETGATKAEQPGEEAGVQWRRYARTLLVTCAAQLAAAALLVLAANPYGNLPLSLFRQHVIMDTNQRYQYPAIARSGQFDSAVVGTSTSRLLRPGALNAKIGGKFANLAMDSATAWEQSQMAKLFADAVAKPRTLIVGIDRMWCYAEDPKRITERGFPDWMFDDNPWNDLPYMLNKRAAEIAIRRLAFAAGAREARIPFDGYQVFVPPEEKYDLAKVKASINRNIETASVVARVDEPSREMRASWSFPALTWLDELLGGRWQKVVLFIPPVHITAHPRGLGRWQEDECKERIAVLARHHNAPLIDFSVASEITSHDENYWDPVHFRVPIAEKVVSDLSQALSSGRDDPGGTWRVLAGSR